MSEPLTFPLERLGTFVVQVFTRLGVPPADADQAADVLIAADRRGIDSHGVARLKAYCDLIAAGRVQPRATVTVLRETPCTAALDGGNGLGLVVGPRANAIAIEKALAVGTGWVTVRNSTHFGIAGYYALTAAERGLIGWSMTNAARAVIPPGGAERMLGTNPISVAFPAGDTEPPIVIDFATSAVAYGKVQIAMRAGKPVPEGWIVDRAGQPTTDPHAVAAGGALLPLGGDMETGGHKGYCLGALVDVLCGVWTFRAAVLDPSARRSRARGRSRHRPLFWRYAHRRVHRPGRVSSARRRLDQDVSRVEAGGGIGRRLGPRRPGTAGGGGPDC
jgi:L-2-hydroxycarboxylate dehydrogenase (NAD+)